MATIYPDEMTGLTFAKWLRAERKKADMTGQELADKVGTSQGNISLYERGGRFPTRARVEEIAVALGVSTADALLAAGYAPKGASLDGVIDLFELEGWNQLDANSREDVREEIIAAVDRALQRARRRADSSEKQDT